MKKNYEKVLEKICTKLKSDPNIVGIILYGSLAKGNIHKYSDIDLYVVKENENDRTTLFFEDLIPVQILWRSVKSFKTKFLKRSRNIPMALVGKILYDPKELLIEYMEKSKLQSYEGPISLSEKEKLMIRNTLSQELKTVKGLVDNNQLAGAILLINEILLEALNGYYDMKKWWLPSNKHIVQDLKLREQELGELAEQVLLCPSIDEKIEKLCKIKDIVLNEMGGEINEYEIVW